MDEKALKLANSRDDAFTVKLEALDHKFQTVVKN